MMSSPDEPDPTVEPESEKSVSDSSPRARRLAAIKAAIDNGTYDTDEKLDEALSRMFDSILDDDSKLKNGQSRS